jgi:hypothetical protein
MIRGYLVAALIFGVLLALWMRGCSGARPVVTRQELHAPRAQAEPYRAEIEVRNEGLGEGEIQVDVRIVDRAGGRSFAEARRLDVRKSEVVRVSIPLWAPRGDYRLEASAEYPAR